MLEILINGLARGSVYALVALGYTMVYGTLGMINFAHGEIFMIGMFASVFALAALGSLGWTSLAIALPIAMLASMLFAAGFGYANERIAYRKLRGAHLLAPLTSAIGVSIVLQNFVMLTVTKGKIDFPRAISGPLAETTWTIGKTSVSALQVILLATSLLIMTALWWFIQKTRFGISLRAVSQDRSMASLVGVPVDRAISLTFMLGAALAASAGTLVAMYQGVLRFDAGYAMGLKAFTAAVLGGIGNVPGAVVGGLLIGVAEDATTTWFGSDWKNTTAFVILILVLLFRPRGLLGERVADKV